MTNLSEYAIIRTDFLGMDSYLPRKESVQYQLLRSVLVKDQDNRVPRWGAGDPQGGFSETFDKASRSER